MGFNSGFKGLNLQVQAVNAVTVEEIFVLLQSKTLRVGRPAGSRNNKMSIFSKKKKSILWAEQIFSF